ncbi:hypothetical protein HDV05_001168 [Chytridiales sp. JEL 0842]|nr:hypothetical protein HDV05_001168 [Chytridiales sp. JEL 0842]
MNTTATYEQLNPPLTVHSYLSLTVFTLIILLCIHPIRLRIPPFLLSAAVPHFLRRLRIPLNLATAPPLGVLILLVSQSIGVNELKDGVLGGDDIKPYSILILVFALAYICISIDETGLFKNIAYRVTRNGGTSGRKLYFNLFVLSTLMTFFTSNDVVVLTVTPIICYLAGSTNSVIKIDATPYLLSNFIVSNIASMGLYIGNPTNVIVAQAYNISFLQYTVYMGLPTLACICASYLLTLLLFWNRIPVSIQETPEDVEGVYAIKDKFGASPGKPGDYLVVKDKNDLRAEESEECSGMSNSGIALQDDTRLRSLSKPKPKLYKFVHRAKSLLKSLLPTTSSILARLPYPLIPFSLSMFTLVSSLKTLGFTSRLSTLLSFLSPNLPSSLFAIGLLTTLASNALNNLPMTILFSTALRHPNFLNAVSDPNIQKGALFALVVGSNLGANLLYMGSLAGLMWRDLIREKGVQLKQWQFFAWCSCVTPVVVVVGCAVLWAEFEYMFRKTMKLISILKLILAVSTVAVVVAEDSGVITPEETAIVVAPPEPTITTTVPTTTTVPAVVQEATPTEEPIKVTEITDTTTTTVPAVVQETTPAEEPIKVTEIIDATTTTVPAVVEETTPAEEPIKVTEITDTTTTTVPVVVEETTPAEEPIKVTEITDTTTTTVPVVVEETTKVEEDPVEPTGTLVVDPPIDETEPVEDVEPTTTPVEEVKTTTNAPTVEPTTTAAPVEETTIEVPDDEYEESTAIIEPTTTVKEQPQPTPTPPPFSLKEFLSEFPSALKTFLDSDINYPSTLPLTAIIRLASKYIGLVSTSTPPELNLGELIPEAVEILNETIMSTLPPNPLVPPIISPSLNLVGSAHLTTFLPTTPTACWLSSYSRPNGALPTVCPDSYDLVNSTTCAPACVAPYKPVGSLCWDGETNYDRFQTNSTSFAAPQCAAPLVESSGLCYKNECAEGYIPQGPQCIQTTCPQHDFFNAPHQCGSLCVSSSVFCTDEVAPLLRNGGTSLVLGFEKGNYTDLPERLKSMAEGLRGVQGCPGLYDVTV